MAKLAWVVGVLAAAGVTAFVLLSILMNDSFGGGHAGATGFFAVVAAALITALSATYARVFRDNWPD